MCWRTRECRPRAGTQTPGHTATCTQAYGCAGCAEPCGLLHATPCGHGPTTENRHHYFCAHHAKRESDRHHGATGTHRQHSRARARTSTRTATVHARLPTPGPQLDRHHAHTHARPLARTTTRHYFLHTTTLHEPRAKRDGPTGTTHTDRQYSCAHAHQHQHTPNDAPLDHTHTCTRPRPLAPRRGGVGGEVLLSASPATRNASPDNSGGTPCSRQPDLWAIAGAVITLSSRSRGEAGSAGLVLLGCLQGPGDGRGASRPDNIPPRCPQG